MSDDEKAVDCALLLVPMAFVTDNTTGKLRAKLHMHRAVEMSDASAPERAAFYRTLLNMRWLPPALRRVILLELGQSAQRQNRDYDDGGTVMLLHMLKEREAAMRARGLRPHGGVHEAAVAEITPQLGMTADALKQRLKRYRRSRKVRGQ